MENKIFITNQIEKIDRGDYTDFLDPYEEYQIVSILNKRNKKYNVLKLFKDCEKSIIYTNTYPNISLLEIISNKPLCHKDILGTLFSHNIKICKYGDIVITDRYFLPVLDSIKPYILSNIDNISNNKVKINNVDINLISDYHYNYEELELLVSSLRIDNIVSTITNLSRSNVEELFDNKFIFINYLNNIKKTYIIKDNDIIAIRKNGKYKYIGISKVTSKNKYIIKLLKYK